MEEEPHHKVNVCEICGGVSAYWESLLAVCSRCSGHIHRYCMPDPNSDIPDEWICDLCPPKTGMNSGKSGAKDATYCDVSVRPIRKRPRERTWQGPSTSQKPPDYGKVKCIGFEEAMKIPLTTSKPKSPLKKRPNIAFKTDETSRRGRSPNQKENTRMHPEPSQLCKDRVFKTGEPVTKQGPRIIKHTEGGNTSNVAEDMCSKPVAKNLQNVHTITWKGDFSIVGITEPIVIGGFQAAFPQGVHPNVYEAAQKMPAVLKVKMLHKSAHLLKKIRFGFADVALYFYSRDKTERSRNMHDELFEFMELEKVIMIGYVDDFELLIFTSNQLNADIHSKFSSKVGKFLWGVFGWKAGSLCRVKEKLPLVVHSYLGDEETVYEKPSEDTEMRGGVVRQEFTIPGSSKPKMVVGHHRLKKKRLLEF